MNDNIVYHNTSCGEVKVSKKISQHKVSFTPTCASDKVINDMEIDFSPLITDNNNKHQDDKNKSQSQFFSLKTISPKRRKKKKSLATFDENFNEIITSLTILGQEKEKERQKKENEEKLNKEKKKSIIKTFLQENEEDIKSLSNTEEINDFYEFNENCYQVIDDIIPINNIPLPKISFPFFKEVPSKKKLAIFDLDETLAHSEFKNIDKAQNIITVKPPSKKEVKIGLNIRPHLKEALDLIKKHYFIIVYTASDRSYADPVLNFIDPNNDYFQYRLYRSHCIYSKVKDDDKIKLYIKDLSIFKNIDLKDMVIIDNSILSYAYHLNNGIPIVPYYKGEKDYELMFLAGYLSSIRKWKDLREANKKYIKLEHLIKQYKRKEKENKDNDDEDSSSGEESPMKNKNCESVISGFLDAANKVNHNNISNN